MIYNGYGNVSNSCTVYIVLFFFAFTIIIGISSGHFDFHGYLIISNINITNINANTETVIY